MVITQEEQERAVQRVFFWMLGQQPEEKREGRPGGDDGNNDCEHWGEAGRESSGNTADNSHQARFPLQRDGTAGRCFS